MGLDMYLQAQRGISGYDFEDESKKDEFTALLNLVGVDRERYMQHGRPFANIGITVAYWRKCWDIHTWFVNEFQDGVDDCRSAYVPRERLVELRDLVAQASAGDEDARDQLNHHNTDEDRLNEELLITLEQLDDILSNPDFEKWDFEYSSSW